MKPTPLDQYLKQLVQMLNDAIDHDKFNAVEDLKLRLHNIGAEQDIDGEWFIEKDAAKDAV